MTSIVAKLYVLSATLLLQFSKPSANVLPASAMQSREMHANDQRFVIQALKLEHDLALELLGERNERVDSLEDDIQEMKHIFHTQLSSLVDEINTLRGSRPVL